MHLRCSNRSTREVRKLEASAERVELINLLHQHRHGRAPFVLELNKDLRVTYIEEADDQAFAKDHLETSWPHCSKTSKPIRSSNFSS